MNRTSSKNPSIKRRITYLVLLILFLFIGTESLLSILYYQNYGGSPLAIIGLFRKLKDRSLEQTSTEKNYWAHQLARPDASDIVNRRIADEVMSSNGFQYQPWIGYSAMNFSGQYIHINGLIRNSSPDFCKGTNSDTLRIYFFGGSTLFGFNVADHETIPSQFVKLLRESGVQSTIQVFNYGIPTYYSYHELMLLTQLYFNGHRPDFLIFLDGLNDLIGVRASARRVSFIDYKFKETFKTDLQWGNPAYRDSFKYIISPNADTDLEKLSDTLYHQYLSTRSAIEKIALAYESQSFFFIQPVPYYKYPAQKKDPLCDKERKLQFEYTYPKLEEEEKRSNNLFFLGNMLEHESGTPFIDGYHYSPSFSKKIAAQIFAHVKPYLEKTPQ